jgi:phenylacetate-CoA ligase
MSYSSIRKKLGSLPVLKQAKNSIKSVFPGFFRPSAGFFKWYNFVNDSDKWSADQLRGYQWTKVKELLSFVYTNVPYYQRVFKTIGATPKDFITEANFEKFPFLTKELLRENVEELIPAGTDKKKLIRYNTGGSTGNPSIIYKTKIDDLIESAFMSSQWARVGYKPNDSRVIIRGEVVADNKLWQYTPSSNSWIFSSYHLSDEYIMRLVDKLNKIRPKFLHVYPSSLWIFANLMKSNNLKINFTPTAILCGSEKLFDHQRIVFNEVFGCRSYSWLGLAEQTVLAGECEYNSDLHIFPQHSYIELVDTSGKIITDSDISGHIAGTNLYRHSFPLIRYLNGDMAQYADGPCKCGRQFKRFKQVEGRVQHVIISKDGRIIPLTALVFGQHLAAFNKIEGMQLFQEKPGEAEIRIIRGKNFTSGDEKELLNQLSYATKFTVVFTISYYNKLERSLSGKQKFLIQNLPVDFFGFDQDSLLSF